MYQAASSAAPVPARWALHLSLWIAQVLLAVTFAMAGALKTTLPVAELTTKLPWAADVPLPLVRFIGTAELLGAVGLVLPSVTRIRPGSWRWPRRASSP